MNFDGVKAITIPEGSVKMITSNGVTLWKIGLPVEYQEVEYILSDGLARIDTGIVARVDNDKIYTVDLDCATDSIYGKANNIIICYTGGSAGSWFGVTASKLLTLGGGVNYSANAFERSIKHIVFKKDKVIATVGGETKERGTNATYTGHIVLFNITTFGSNTKMYSAKVYEGNELIAELVPCYRKADGEIGLYDKKRNIFFSNVGSGSFTKGSDV